MKSLIDIPKKMKALVLEGVGDLRLEEVDVPELKEGTVLVKLRACGICSSDIPRVFVTGTYHFPTIPGHEFSGEIAAVGDGVDESLLGRRTCVFPMLPCRNCKACQKEEWAQCSSYSYFGSRQDGGMAEYLVAPVWNLVPFADSVPFEHAALCEPSAVSLHAVKLGKVAEGDNVLVIGTGAIGLLIASFAKARSGKNVAVAGRSADKLAYASKLGFETIDTSKEDISEGAKRIFGDCADVTIEAVGSNEAINNAVKATAALGRIVLVGNPYGDLTMDKNTYWSILRKQINITGSWNSSFNSRINDWKEAVSEFESGRIDLGGLVTQTYTLEEYEKAFADVRDKNTFTLRVVFKMGD